MKNIFVELKSGLFFLMTMLLAPACVPTVIATQAHITREEGRGLEAQCLALKNETSLKQTLNGLRFHTGELLQTLAAQSEGGAIPDIKRNKRNISRSIGELLRLANSEYFKLDYTQDLRWMIDEKVLRELKLSSDRWTVHASRVQGVFSWNSESEDLQHHSNQTLVNDFNIHQTPKTVEFQLSRLAHAVELCELQNSLHVMVEIDLISAKQRIRTKLVKLSVVADEK